ncbi:dynein light chain roadblock-type 2-like [Oppia nitens]|uniref:dynein light chain roadblock-type 2-like n=1 Tax=Oppia nitens TaxID=1686743 RepID=UPI0023DAFF0C|nr:dynein light chain roadblock-type 2-like [Oppia nitens]
MADTDEILKRIQASHKGVIGTIVVDSEGVVIKATIPDSPDIQQLYGVTISQMVDRAKQALKDNDELTFLKIKTKKHEFIVVPDKDYVLITVINPNESNA